MSVLDHLDGTIGDSGIGALGATVAALQQALSSGSLTSAALTASYLDRIERLNPGLHAVISVSANALAEAAASDAARASGTVRGPLEGVPVLLKDNIAAAGLPATAGSPALAGTESGDAFLVSGLRAAGAVILGKANLSEWANIRSTGSSSGWSTLGGQTVNPRGAGRNTSGSSSGSAAAVAAGLAPAAVGTETNGSIVSPASACGVVGLKPTVGLISRQGVVPISGVQDTAGPMTCCVADAAALLGPMAGPDPADAATARAPGLPGDYTAFLDAGALAGARLGIWRDGSKEASRATAAVLDAAVERLRSAGAQIIDPVALPGLDEADGPELIALLHEFKHDLNAYLDALPGEHPTTLAELIEFNKRNADQVLVHFDQDLFEQAEATSGDLSDPAYLTARAEADRIHHAALDGALAEHRLDAVVSLTGGPARLTDHVLGDLSDFSTSGPAAVCGYPSLTVPAGDVGGLPVGLSLSGPAWSEPRLIALAFAFEQAAEVR
ncbi:MAG TPA: amidase [Streptosporangiaceae bacterium]|nr:amidase [Streptosporangiaceae bacterium]